ncbi:MAG: deoxyribonuclease IV [Candidatus Sungbacteria bacterium]|uniref:Deoxyribonuclease IV n=1 Tax=Candidatus Sungiibacteriota bacterium TaxID=2750080 RepID=A0A9D6LUF9_9BACT|nr:deoxyribonuclease IV [Candidatus Sungbacteria bacterium]
MKRPKLGAHVSVAGKLSNGIERAQSIGAECIQIFGASPKQWAVRGHEARDIEDFKKAREAAGIGPVYLHAAYLVNLCSPDSSSRQKSEVNLADHLKIASAIGAEGLIFHIGSGKEMPKDKALAIVVESIQRILLHVPGLAQLVIENSAGGGQKIGGNPEEIGEILSRVKSSRLKVCWDTAHAFESGIIEEYDAKRTKGMAKRLDQAFGMDALVAMHINDSKTAFNSRHDRHENIGQGHIGLEGFKVLAREKLFADAAWILEVPGFDGTGPDKKNIEILHSLFVRSR